ncbi:aminotransferase [Agromyces luteolus]|uniref:Aminotransferase n=1 Tax=Agromyces luteolus TaxID=88373 RepID=A0A7C9HJ33_9MICO|nr:aminotransferase [Agromyces luteolus]MUN08263.1 aminotransferase [Agromyces luteolus]GLK26796.1 aminotransferase [Agromyces luteolus]
MKIDEFQVEIWMNAYENDCGYNLAETCVRSLTTGELLELSGRRDEILAEMEATPLTYGPIPGSDRLRALIAGLYEHQSPENVTVTHGAIGANALIHQTLIEPGDHVISVLPTYQQHYAIPASFGADVDVLLLRERDGWLPDLDELRAMLRPTTKLIAVNNPNNPTGSLMSESMLEEIAAMAGSVGAWVLSDEVYRGIDQEGDGFTASMADLYDRGISTGSMSKPFSLAGLRLGWIVGPREIIDAVSIHRDYNTISVGRIDDLLASVALEQRDAILARARDITRRNLALVDGWVNGRNDVSYIRPASGTTALIRYTAPIPSYEFCIRLLEQTGVMLTPGAAFDIEGTFRIGFADDTEALREGLSLVGEFLDALRGGTHRQRLA